LIKMDELKKTSVIVKPVISEKSYALADSKVYVFLVERHANKFEIKQAIEKAFNVKVAQVNTLTKLGKKVRNLRTGKIGQKPTYKKAYVKLRPGYQIDLFEEIRG